MSGQKIIDGLQQAIELAKAGLPPPDPRYEAVLEVIKAMAPGLKAGPGYGARFIRMLNKRGFDVVTEKSKTSIPSPLTPADDTEGKEK